jgi:carbon-monoxide dehydrogenase small subunit
MTPELIEVSVTVNGRPERLVVEPRATAADVVREQLGLTGTHLACEHGVCGACTVLVDGEAMRSCLLFACQLEGLEVTTVEGLTPATGDLSAVQQALRACHGLQCGFCTPGFVVSITALLARVPHPSERDIREALSGNLCRCTGYDGIVRAVQSLATAEPTS